VDDAAGWAHRVPALSARLVRFDDIASFIENANRSIM
jgi:hypothetical protein